MNLRLPSWKLPREREARFGPAADRASGAAERGSGTQLSVADIVAGATVRFVAAKDGCGYTASSVQIVEPTATGQSN